MRTAWSIYTIWLIMLGIHLHIRISPWMWIVVVPMLAFSLFCLTAPRDKETR